MAATVEAGAVAGKRAVEPSRVFDVGTAAYGAVADGHTDARPAILAAISACHDAGGGRVRLPRAAVVDDSKCVYLVGGPIVLPSGVELHVCRGVTLLFSGVAEHFCRDGLAYVRWEGTFCYNYCPCIYAYDSTNLGISGHGLIDGNGRAFKGWREKAKAGREKIRRLGAETGADVTSRRFGPTYYMRPCLIEFVDCIDVFVQGVTLIDPPFWTIHPVLCLRVYIQGVTVRSEPLNTDGVDPDSSTDVLIEGCTFDTGDDAVAVKSGRDQDGWRVGRPCEQVTIRNCTISSRRNGLCVGSELSGGVRNVTFEHCHVLSARVGIFIKTNSDRGGFVDNVTANDITMDEVTEHAICISTHYQQAHAGRLLRGSGTAPTVIGRTTFTNVTCKLVHQAAVVIDCENQLRDRDHNFGVTLSHVDVHTDLRLCQQATVVHTPPNCIDVSDAKLNGKFLPTEGGCKLM
eukprot:TRINITY_DN7051_c0_g1_i1.p1 TRINITY_DN7051_c0_g1~~TRINITY_DN7051_c0_g1_i1.p1  ORF type:complete len:460 (+),score=75.31 TRINITY_DN7051_c0_g1_i1:144-1523(+)